MLLLIFVTSAFVFVFRRRVTGFNRHFNYRGNQQEGHKANDRVNCFHSSSLSQHLYPLTNVPYNLQMVHQPEHDKQKSNHDEPKIIKLGFHFHTPISRANSPTATDSETLCIRANKFMASIGRIPHTWHPHNCRRVSIQNDSW